MKEFFVRLGAFVGALLALFALLWITVPEISENWEIIVVQGGLGLAAFKDSMYFICTACAGLPVVILVMGIAFERAFRGWSKIEKVTEAGNPND